MKSIAFFGHRQIFEKTIIADRLLKILKDIIPQGYSKLLIGSHGEFDKLVLSTCIKYRNNFEPNIEINVILTNLSLLNKNNLESSKIDFYEHNKCKTMFYDIEEVYFKNRITYSNKKMVDASDLIICYVDTRSYRSGAKTAVNYAIKKNKKIINLFEQGDKKII